MCIFFSAVLISGLKGKNIDTCPYMIKRAMENTALYNDKIDRSKYVTNCNFSIRINLNIVIMQMSLLLYYIYIMY